MNVTTLHPRAADYLDRLRRAAASLPRTRRDELLADIESHLAEAIDLHASDAEALSVLERLGEPEDIIEAEQPRAAAVAHPRGTQEWAAILLLLFGGFAAMVGWLAGLIFLWGSRAWTTREKWIGTLIIPGGLATSVFATAYLSIGAPEACISSGNATNPCTGGQSAGDILLVVVIVILVLAPIATSIYLARRAKAR